MIAPVPEPGRGLAPVPAQAQRDFTIPPPQDAPARPAPPAAEGAAGPAPSPFTGLGQAPTGTEIALGAGALVLLALLFLFVRAGVRAHLVGRRAALDAANGASWMLFSALMLTATLLVGATVGRLWEAWAALAGGLLLCLVLFAAALVLFLRAPERRR